MNVPEYITVWSGRGSIPGMSGEGWRQKECARWPEPEKVKPVEVIVASPRSRCGCGRLSSRGKRRCWKCREMKRYTKVRAA